jgi:hypothetical protein
VKSLFLKFLIQFLSDKNLDLTVHSTEQYLIMCYIDLFDAAPAVNSLADLYRKLEQVFDKDEIRDEVVSFLMFRLEQSESIEKNIELKKSSVLKLHGRYTRNQILSGFSQNTLQNKVISQSGVHRIRDFENETELLFVDTI